MQFTAKTVEDATAMGLKELGIEEKDAIITVIEKPVKGLFGRLKGQAVVEISKLELPEVPATPEKTEKSVKAEKPVKQENQEKPELSTEIPEKAIKEAEFLKKALSFLEIDAKVAYSENGEKEILTLVTDGKSSSAIGYRGEVLDALQTLVGAVANIGNDVYKKVVVDCENYRGKREDTLIALARKLEAKATEMKREVVLEPMSPFERRIIHNALSSSTTVTTRSDGKDPNRYVVIVPNDKDEYAKPYNAGRKKEGGDKYHHGGNRNTHGGKGGRKPNGGKGGYKNNFSEERKKPSMSFGTYLGNSFKDKNDGN